MIKLFLFLGSVFFITQSNIPLQLFDKISGEKTTGYISKNDTSEYEFKNYYGDISLNVSSLELEKQLDIWLKSTIKDDFLDLFPDFDELRNFVKERIVGKELSEIILNKISTVEDNYISGSLDLISAKKQLILKKLQTST